MTNFVPQPPVLDERTLLLELNHRINNEFGAAINLVCLAALRADNSEVKAALGDVVDLLDRYADVHRVLTMPDSDAMVDAGEYLRKLSVAMSRYGLDRSNVRLVLAADTLPLQSERCWRLGLVVHELVANSLRHADFDERDGEIKVELARAGALVACRVSDNGSAAGRVKPARGLSIVSDLAKSLSGRVEYDSAAARTSFVLAFPLTQREEQANGTFASRRRRAARQLRAGVRSLRRWRDGSERHGRRSPTSVARDAGLARAQLGTPRSPFRAMDVS